MTKDCELDLNRVWDDSTLLLLNSQVAGIKKKVHFCINHWYVDICRCTNLELERSVVELSMKAKPVTTFRDCFSTLVSVKPLFCNRETGGQFLAMFVATKTYIYSNSSIHWRRQLPCKVPTSTSVPCPRTLQHADNLCLKQTSCKVQKCTLQTCNSGDWVVLKDQHVHLQYCIN